MNTYINYIQIKKLTPTAITPKRQTGGAAGYDLYIDSDYRGSVGLPLHNDTDTVKIIEPYSRVAQIVFQKTFTPSLIEVEELAETKRGDSGFGSSGI